MNYKTILPASGHATRIGGAPKFLLPLYDSTLINIIINKCKKINNNIILIPTLPKYSSMIYSQVNDDNTFVIGLETQSMSETVIKLRDLCESTTTIFAMPDAYFEGNHFKKMLSILENPKIDICIGLWKILPKQKGKLGQCKFNADFMLEDIVDKNPSCDYEWAWGIACWKPILWQYIDPKTPHVGYAFKKALQNNCKIYCHLIEKRYHDCGTLDEYKELLMLS